MYASRTLMKLCIGMVVVLIAVSLAMAFVPGLFLSMAVVGGVVVLCTIGLLGYMFLKPIRPV